MAAVKLRQAVRRQARQPRQGSIRASKAIREFQAELAVKNVVLEVTDRCRAWLADKGYSKSFGAREVNRLVAAKIKDFFVDEVLFGRLAGGGRAVADLSEDADDVRVTVT